VEKYWKDKSSGTEDTWQLMNEHVRHHRLKIELIKYLTSIFSCVAIASSNFLWGAERRLPRLHIKSHFPPVSPYSSLLLWWVVLLLPCPYFAPVSFLWFPSLRFSVPSVLRPLFLDFLHPSLSVAARRCWILTLSYI